MNFLEKFVVCVRESINGTISESDENLMVVPSVVREEKDDRLENLRNLPFGDNRLI